VIDLALELSVRLHRLAGERAIPTGARRAR
jgi:hypothetical protein